MSVAADIGVCRSTEVAFEEGVDLRNCTVEEGSGSRFGRWLVEVRFNFCEQREQGRDAGRDG